MVKSLTMKEILIFPQELKVNRLREQELLGTGNMKVINNKKVVIKMVIFACIGIIFRVEIQLEQDVSTKKVV